LMLRRCGVQKVIIKSDQKKRVRFNLLSFNL
jgi:hypothetical protein